MFDICSINYIFFPLLLEQGYKIRFTQPAKYISNIKYRNIRMSEMLHDEFSIREHTLS